MKKSKDTTRYVGIDKEVDGAMSDTAKIIRDAWVFGIIDETETCAGWLPQGIEDLWRKVNVEWEKYQFSVGKLPDDLRERFMRIQTAAVAKAKQEGWDPELKDDE